MSTFAMQAEHKATGEVCEIMCLDDYFGRHKYGYLSSRDLADYMTEEEFYSQYEPVE